MSAALYAPSADLTDLVKAYVVHSTCDAPMPACGWRMTRFPAMTFCSLSFLLRGRAAWLPLDAEVAEEDLAPDHPALRTTPPVFVSGPLSRPVLGVQTTPIDTMTIAFHAPAFFALTGARAADLRDRPACDAAHFGHPLGDLAERLAATAYGPDRVRIAETFVAPLWQAARSRFDSRLLHAGALLSRLGVQAAALWLRWTERTLERRVRDGYGMTPREVRRLLRAENAFRAARDDADPRLAELAAEHGYADQAHLSRDVAALLGRPPARLLRDVRGDDDSFWAYRL